MQANHPRVSGPRAALAAAATLVCLLPFAGRAFHIDDPLNLWVARHLHEDPLGFFDLSVNWSGSELPFAMESKNPPLVSYYTAAAAALLGWSERALHLAFWLPALCVVLATGGLARRLGGDPLLASLSCLAFPVFLVSATTLMSDVPMLALFCLALLAWMRGIEERRRGYLLLGAVLAGLCALTKYFGLALLPLLLAWTLARERRLGAWLGYLAIPVLCVAAYEWYTARAFGGGLIVHAARFSLATRPDDTGTAERLLISLLFAGGAFAPLLGFAPWALSRRLGRVALALAALLLGASLGAGRLAELARGADGWDWNLLAHLLVFAGAAAALCLIGPRARDEARDPGWWLLGLWALGTFVFAALVNYTTNGRALLPMAPALAIAVSRRIEARRLTPRLRYALPLPGLALALAVAWGDTVQADASRRAAAQLSEAASGPGNRWLDGHWGFQLYLEDRGWRAVDARRSVLRPGDWLASPLGWQRPLRVPPAAASRVLVVEEPLAPITTMSTESAAGFYAIQWGPLPYRLRSGQRERFELRRIDEYLVFSSDPEVVARRSQEVADADAWLEARRTAPVPPACEGAARALAASLEACTWCAEPGECRECVASQARQRGAGAECLASWR